MTENEERTIIWSRGRDLLLSDDLSIPNWGASDENSGEDADELARGDHHWLDEALEKVEQETVTDPDQSPLENSDQPGGTLIHCRHSCESCGNSNIGLQHPTCEAPIIRVDDTWQCGQCGVTIGLPDRCTECGGNIDHQLLEVPFDLSLTAKPTEIEKAVHEETNRRREDHGLQELSYSDHLSAIAQKHSRDMAERDFFSHSNPDGEEPIDRYRRFGHSDKSSGENIARTYPSVLGTAKDAANAVVSDWMQSPGHRENILRDQFVEEGIGIYLASDGAMFATQNFF
jgi:uncharacterized protein YkwD